MIFSPPKNVLESESQRLQEGKKREGKKGINVHSFASPQACIYAHIHLMIHVGLASLGYLDKIVRSNCKTLLSSLSYSLLLERSFAGLCTKSYFNFPNRK